jgi:hypothetical protein
MAVGLAVTLFLAAGHAGARTLTLDVERVRGVRFDIERMHLQLADGADPALAIAVEHVASAQLGLSGSIEWSCSLRHDADDALACAAPVHLRDGQHEYVAELAARVVDRRVDLSLSSAGSRVTLNLPLDATTPLSVALQRVPAAWLAHPLASYWPGGELRAGTIDLTASLPGSGRLDADFVGDDLVFNTNDGTVSGESVTLNGHATTLAVDAATQVRTNVRVSAGVLRAGTLRVEFPASGVDVDLEARAADGNWEVGRFAWSDPAALEFEATGVLDTSAVAPLRSLTVSRASLVFPQAKQRYAAAIFAAHGLADLAVRGRLEGAAEVDRNGLRRLVLQTSGLELDDRTRAVSVQALVGGLDWTASGDGNATRIGWHKASIAGITLGASSAQWQSHEGTLRLLSPLRMPVFGGSIELRDTLLAPFASGGAHAASGFVLHDIGYDSSDGSLAAAHVDARGELQLDATVDGPRIRMEAHLDGGEALIGPVYAKFPASGIVTALDLAMVGERWHLAHFDWSDPDVLELEASGEVLPRADSPMQSLQFDLRRAQLAKALPRYASSWLSTKGYGELAADGSIGGTLTLSEGKPSRFTLRADDVAVHDRRSRFALEGLDGGIDWDFASDRPSTTLGWRAIELFRIPLGAAHARLQALAGAITLTEPLAVDVLGGQVKLEHFSAQPRSPRGNRYAGSFALAGLEMARVSDAFGWPRFPGNLSGGIPQIEFVGDRIEFHGGLDLYVFDGHLGVSGLALERPFGVAPSLAADVHFENLDLQQVTSAFSFGGMSGRLSGTLAALRLVDWNPVAFDAWLRTDGGGRMSYKAVNDLTSIGGGGGLSAGLQTMALKIFDTFGYRRLGIRCLLRDEVCTMGGIEPLPAAGTDVDSSGAGYTIVEGSGVPRITIVGHRRNVDWPTLVRRLREATQGQGPVVE